MLFWNNVNFRHGEQYAIDAIQQQLLSAILRFGVATSVSKLTPSLSMAQSQQQQQQHEQ
ncbi:hypothetical protein DPMN_043705 [Dreissena polymorpha]|uniref:Uncharacterized protein n=1 Tax=Dreissena polymorpha TaxID=45954 RepID=A0A9D4D2W2_DREPO|nr:hypothetical protein DPMN_043705 [Dreissena polymorpha]